MKRMLAIILSIILIASCISAIAEQNEPLSVRGGITFASTKQEILEYEKSQGGNIKEKTEKDSWYTDNCIEVSKISLAGYDDATVVYYFNDDDSLSSILFTFYQNIDDKASGDKQFSIIDDALSKYGTPIATGTEYLEINSEAMDVLDYFNDEVFHGSSSGEHGSNTYTSTVIAFNQRLYEQNDGVIDIKDMEFDWNKVITLEGLGSMSSDLYYVAISYTFCTPDQMEAIYNKAADKANALNNDL